MVDALASSHEHFIEHWLRKREVPTSHDRMARLLFQAVATVRMRARATLGEVTFAAIFHRVFATAQLRHAFLADVGPQRFAGDECRTEHLRAATADELRAATKHLITELIRVLGALTGNALTGALYVELENVVTMNVSERGEP